MKRFKKVLALVLAGVMALALLTACGETDPDKVVPDDAMKVMMALDSAADAGSGNAQPAEYSVKYSKITEELLKNWLQYGASGAKEYNLDKYWENYGKIMQSAEGATVVVGLTQGSGQPSVISYNPAKTTPDATGYKAILASGNYDLADKTGVAFVTTDDGSKYQLVCMFKLPKG